MLLSSQLVVDISREEKKSGISEVVGILLIRVIRLSATYMLGLYFVMSHIRLY